MIDLAAALLTGPFLPLPSLVRILYESWPRPGCTYSECCTMNIGKSGPGRPDRAAEA